MISRFPRALGGLFYEKDLVFFRKKVKKYKFAIETRNKI